MAVATAADRPLALTRHLEELRRALLISLGAWLACTAVAMVFHRVVLGVLLAPLHTVLRHTRAVVTSAVITSPTEGLTVPLKVAAVAGVVMAMPVILWQVWRFIRPGLTVAERRVALPLVGSALVLFAVGAGCAYTVMPVGLGVLATFLGDNATYLPDITAYLSFFSLVIIAFGVTFELPVVVLLLGLMHIVSSAGLRRHRGAIWTAITVVALMVTPGADPFTPLALLLPLVALFEASVVVLDRGLHR